MDAHVDDFVDRVADRLACTRCLRDAALRASAAAAGFDATCDYCGRAGTCVDVAWLADGVHGRVQDAFARADARTARSLDSLTLIARAARFDLALARDVHAQLASLHRDDDGGALYGDGCTYAVRDTRPMLASWDAFVAAVERDASDAAQSRALDALKWAFAGLDGLRTGKGRPVVRTWRAGTRIHRACREDTAPSPGAIDGVGAVTAVATDARTAIAEARPALHAIVHVTRLRLARDLRVLDVDALCKALARTSGFDASGFDAHARADFVRGWRDAWRRAPADVAHPGPGAIAFVLDWLAHGPSPRLDGVAARSDYGTGRTVGVFVAAGPALRPGRRRRYAVDGIRIGYRRLDRSAEVARRFADADREQGDDADAGHDDDFHGSPP